MIVNRTTAVSGVPALSSAASSASAWWTVRGNPSRMNPFDASGSSSRSCTIRTMTPSGTYSPRSMKVRASIPRWVPSSTCSRRMSPVEICGISRSSDSRRAWVPLPAPGSPMNTKRIRTAFPRG